MLFCEKAVPKWWRVKTLKHACENLLFLVRFTRSWTHWNFSLKIFNHKCGTVSLQNGFCRTLNASILWNLGASVLCNCYLDLTDGVKIQQLAINVYFGNNVVMVILLKTRMEYPFAHSLHRNFFMSEIKVFMNDWTASINFTPVRAWFIPKAL